MISESIRRELRHVRVADPRVALDRFPDFLILGPQRTGTTWLHAQLRFHPQIFLSEPKEIFYFSRLQTPEHPRFQSAELSWYLQFFREKPWWWAVKMATCLWRFREPYRPKVRGEATASYAVLDDEVIREIVLLKPSIRAILMIRDPIERAWSHAKKDLARNRGRSLEQVSDSEMEGFFADGYQRACARYVDNIERWGRHLRDGHLFVGLFDDIAHRPEDLLLDVMRFLGVRSERRYLPSDVRAAVNPTTESRIPLPQRMRLESLLAPDLQELRDRFGLAWPLSPHAPRIQSFVHRKR